MPANETPVCVTIRDCCTAGFDVHLQASSSSSSFSSFCPRFISCRAFPPSSPLLSYPWSRSRRSKKEKERKKGRERFGQVCVYRPWRCKSAKTNRNRNRRSEEKEAKRAGNGSGNVGAERRIGRQASSSRLSSSTLIQRVGKLFQLLLRSPVRFLRGYYHSREAWERGRGKRLERVSSATLL